MTRKIIIDTDPGQDDAVAILLALASPEELDVLGIVAVAGNVGLRQNARNALKVVELSGRTDVPVHAGCEGPMRRPLVTAEHVHGQTGLDGPDLPEPQIALRAEHGVDFIIRTLLEQPAGTVTLCALGPLTNLAMAFVKAPHIVERIERIVLMGGAYFEVGNITPAAEFNIYVDPEAAHVVFTCGVPIVQIPLDATHGVLTTRERLAAFRALGNRTGEAVARMLAFSERFDLEKYGSTGAPLHDPCVIAHVLRPDLFEGRQINVSIETSSELTRGMTVADYWRITDRPRNVMFVRSADAEGVYALLNERLARLS
jgi:inosine-uridine nucleoside N-ribohydrolase